MAENVIFSELLCFLKSHFGNTPLSGILSVISSYYTEDEICKAKLQIHELCCKNLDESDVPRLVNRKGDNKRKMDSEDIGKFFVILDEHKIVLPQFAAINLRRVPQIDPSNIDLCFLLESVEDLRKSVAGLLDVRKDIDNLQTTVSALSRSSIVAPARTNVSHRQDSGSGLKSAQQSVPVGSSKAIPSYSQTLRVNLPPASDGNPQSFTTVSRAKPIIGTKQADSSTATKLKASNEPRAFHLYVGNLDTSYDSSAVSDYLKEINIKVLSCEIVHSRHSSDDYIPRATSAHVVIDATDKEKALSSSTWETGIVVRPWRFPRKHWSQDIDNRRW
jgi:hypothetical protein